MNRYAVRNPFAPLIQRAVSEAIATSATVAAAPTATALVDTETQTELVTVDPETGATLYPFQLNTDVLNAPNARLYSL